MPRPISYAVFCLKKKNADAADFDLDGDLDVFSGLGGDKDVVLILNKGDGPFDDPIIIATYIIFFNDAPTTEIYALSLHDALPISFYDNPNALRDYFRDIGRMVLAAEGKS